MYNHFWKEPLNEKTFMVHAVSWEMTDESNFDVRRYRGQSPSLIECHNLLRGCDTRLDLDFDPIGCDRKINPSKRSEFCVCDATELWEMCVWCFFLQDVAVSAKYRRPNSTHGRALTAVSYVGCSLSSVASLITVLTILGYKYVS